jgi:hypothetical protein
VASERRAPLPRKPVFIGPAIGLNSRWTSDAPHPTHTGCSEDPTRASNSIPHARQRKSYLGIVDRIRLQPRMTERQRRSEQTYVAPQRAWPRPLMIEWRRPERVGGEHQLVGALPRTVWRGAGARRWVGAATAGRWSHRGVICPGLRQTQVSSVGGSIPPWPTLTAPHQRGFRLKGTVPNLRATASCRACLPRRRARPGTDARMISARDAVGRQAMLRGGCATLGGSDSEGNKRARPSTERPLPAKAA